MTQLSPGNFTGAEKKASGGPYKGSTYTQIAETKISKGLPFVFGSNDNGTKVLGKELSKEASVVELSYIDAGKKVKVERISKFLKDLDFGGGKGSGGGAADTAWTESLQCYYTSLLYNGGVKYPLTIKTATTQKLQQQDNFCFTFNKTRKLNFKTCYDNGPEDWLTNDVYIKTANAIYNSVKGRKFRGGKPVYFHRGSPFMGRIYDIKKKCLHHDKKSKQSIAPGSFMDDKWNPGDIWMSALLPTTHGPFDKDGFCPCEFTDVREAVFESANNGTTLGVSLKKVVGPQARVEEYNTPKRTHNKKVKFEGFTFGQTGDFFSSIDVYLYFDVAKVQLRATQTTKSWQGEIKGAFAAGGKIGGGNLNYYTQKSMGKSIGKMGVVEGWSETSPGQAKKDVVKMHKLYQKYNTKQNTISGRKASSVSLSDFKELIEGTNNPDSFYFSKYMCLMFLDTVYSNPSKLNEFATDIIRYAASNTDISSFYIKVS